MIACGESQIIVWQITQATLLAGSPHGSATTPFDALLGSLLDPPWHKGFEVPLVNPSTAPANRRSNMLAHQLLLKQTDLGDWNVVGGFVDDNLAIKDSERGKKLTTKLILRCLLHQASAQFRKLTIEGAAALTRAHRIAVTDALNTGLPVPENVRADYGL